MREIKFRAWDKRKNNWVDYPIYIDANGDVYWENYERGLQEADDLIVMQYTGLKDQKGVEIFEGDIVLGGRLTSNDFFIVNDKPTTVRFASGMFKAGQISLCTINMRCEVIGNIYDNSDLI